MPTTHVQVVHPLALRGGLVALLLALPLLPALLVASTTETGGSEALRPAAAPLAADPCDLDMVTCDSGSTR